MNFITIRARLTFLAKGLLRYGPFFVAEVLVFWLILLVVNSSGYGSSFGADFPWPAPPGYALTDLAIVGFAMGAGEATFRLYRRVWSVASLNDAFAIGSAVVEATLIVTIINLLFADGVRPLRLLAAALAAPAVVIAIGLLRLQPRLRASARPTGNRLLVVIRDAGGYSTVKALLQQPNPDWTPVAVVTTAPADVGRTLAGVPVLGTAAHMRRWIRDAAAQGVAFVNGSATDRAEARRLYAECLAAELPVFIVPAADEWFPRPNGSRLRQLSADDLVGRAEREIDLARAAGEVRGRTVLVTGAAGSIGSELSRLLAGMDPLRLVLLDNNESGLFDLCEELRAATTLDIREALVSIVDNDQLLALFADERPDVVFHVAAYKHVPMLESHPVQAVLTNVIGTSNALRCAHAAGVKRFILISTDKASSKHSVMGCTKRLCEQLLLAYRGPMHCSAVRFGNVVGSRGSVVPLFERQIEQGGPVTITHRDASRYMMTIREAASLVLSSLVTSKPGHLYMLDMGEPIRIYDLANDLIRSRGLRPDIDIKIVFTGLRPGDRLTEDLLASDEGWRPTEHPTIREVISPKVGKEEDLAWIVERLERLAREGRSDELVRALKNAVQGPAEQTEEPRVPGAPESQAKEQGKA
jgi:FlaA1/EpsC-like NDP-sugar epimerase